MTLSGPVPGRVLGRAFAAAVLAAAIAASWPVAAAEPAAAAPDARVDAAPGPAGAAALAADAPNGAALDLPALALRDGIVLGVLLLVALLAATAAGLLRDEAAAALAALALAFAGLVLSGGAVSAALWPGPAHPPGAGRAAFAALAAHAGVLLGARWLGQRLRGAPAAIALFALAAAAVAPFAARVGAAAVGVAVLASLALLAAWAGAAVGRHANGARGLALALAPVLVVATAEVLAAVRLVPARPADAAALPAALAFSAAVLAIAAGDRLLGRRTAAQAALARAAEARTSELAGAIDALRREGEARRRAEEGRQEAEETLRRERHRAALGVVSPVSSADRPSTILVVDGDDLVRDGTRRALERLGYLVIEASDGREALRSCEAAGGVDLLVAEVILGGMSGKELADRVAVRWPRTRVLLTADSAHDVLGASPAGFPFLPKPYLPGALAAKVREILGPRARWNA